MVHNENAEWDEFSALLDTVVEDTSESTHDTRADAYHASQTHAQAQEELQSGCTYEDNEDDNDLEEVDVDRFAMEPQAKMEAESRTTTRHQNPTHEALSTGPVVAEAPVGLSSGSSSTATTRSAEPQFEAAANRARATRKGYLARRRAARKSASLQTAKNGSMTPQAPSIVATGPPTLPPPPPLPVGPAGRRQLWEGELKLGLPHLKAGYRIALPPARPASAPVVGVPSAGPVPQVGARHQSAPVASTSRGKRSRDAEDRGDDVVQKRPKVNNAQSRKRTKASAPSPSGGTHRPQWTPYAAQQTEPSRIHGSAPVTQQNVQPRRAEPSTETSREMNGAPMNRAGHGGAAAYIMRLPPPPTLQRPLQETPGAGPSHHSDERMRTQTYAPPVLPSTLYDPASVSGTFSRAVLSAAASGGTRNRTHSEVHGNATGPQQRQPEMRQAGPSRRAYEQVYDRAGVEHPYDQPTSPQSCMMPVPSGWNDPAAIPRTFARTGLSVSTIQPEGQSVYGRAQDAPVAYAARPQQQMERSVPPMIGGGIAPADAEWQLPNVDAPRNQAVSNQPYAPQMPMPSGWSSNVGGGRVPAHLTVYAPPNYPPPGWNPQVQAPVYEQEPSAQSFSRGQSVYGYGYDF